MVVFAKGCAICLVVLVVLPVTAPFRTLDNLSWRDLSRAVLNVQAGSDAACSDDATLTNDPVLAMSIRFAAAILLGAVCGVFGPLPAAGSPPVRASGTPAGYSRVSPVLRL